MADASDSFPYRRIAADLRHEILADEREPGSRLPSEHDLANAYGASRPTVRRAIAQLKAEGLVVAEQGRATFVRPKPQIRMVLTGENYRRHREAGVTGFNAQILEQGKRPEQQLLQVNTIDATSEVAAHLALAVGESVVVRRRLFLVDEQPMAFCDSYYPADLVGGTVIAEPRRIVGGVHSVIEDIDGPIRRRIARSVDQLISRMPTHDEAVDLVLLPGIPVVRVMRTVYDTEDRAVELQCTVAAADRHEFRYEVTMT